MHSSLIARYSSLNFPAIVQQKKQMRGRICFLFLIGLVGTGWGLDHGRVTQ